MGIWDSLFGTPSAPPTKLDDPGEVKYMGRVEKAAQDLYAKKHPKGPR